MPALFGDLFKTTRVEVLQSVASEQLEEVIKMLVAELNAVSEAQKTVDVQALKAQVGHLVADNERSRAEVVKLQEAQVSVLSPSLFMTQEEPKSQDHSLYKVVSPLDRCRMPLRDVYRSWKGEPPTCKNSWRCGNFSGYNFPQHGMLLLCISVSNAKMRLIFASF